MVYDKTFFDTYGLAIIIAILIVLSIAAFFLTGFIFVSKQRVAVIEKVGNYYSIITRLTFNQAIDIPGGNLQTQILVTFTKHNCINQLWKFIKVNDN